MRERHRDRLQSYLTELFRLYWSVQLDASSVDQIAALLESLNAGGAFFSKWCMDEGPSMANALADELRGLGMFQVPTFVIDDEIFIGRQHLPMIRWVLDGRSGPIPI